MATALTRRVGRQHKSEDVPHSVWASICPSVTRVSSARRNVNSCCTTNERGGNPVQHATWYTLIDTVFKCLSAFVRGPFDVLSAPMSLPEFRECTLASVMIWGNSEAFVLEVCMLWFETGQRSLNINSRHAGQTKLLKAIGRGEDVWGFSRLKSWSE